MSETKIKALMLTMRKTRHQGGRVAIKMATVDVVSDHADSPGCQVNGYAVTETMDDVIQQLGWSNKETAP